MPRPTLTPRAVEQMVLGVSTRSYERSLEPTLSGNKSRGASRSAVSRRFVAATTQTLTEMMGRDLSGLAICALIIDGIHMCDHLIVIALGIDEHGEKHVLGCMKARRKTRARARRSSKTRSPVAYAATARGAATSRTTCPNR